MKRIRLLSWIMAVMMIVSAVPALSVSATESDVTDEVTTLVDTTDATDEVDSALEEAFNKAVTYADYLAKNSGGAGSEEIAVTPKDEIEEQSDIYELSFDVADAGFYSLVFDYHYQDPGNKKVAYSILLDGKMPYKEAYNLRLSRLWTNEQEIYTDDNGDDVNPKQVEATGEDSWRRNYAVYDKEGYYNAPLKFYFKQGAHTITLDMSNDDVVISNVKLVPSKEVGTYDEYLSKHSGAVYTGENVPVQGESANVKTEMHLIAQNDITNPLTTPYDAAKIKLNTFGGANWKLPGETAVWTINVETAGLYKFAMRYRQNFYDGVAVHRRLYVNGAVPFAEANDLEFPYDTEWQTFVLKTAAGNDAYIYLDAGVNTIALEAVLGDSNTIAEQLEASVLEMNNIYRDVIMITGSSPDDYRDYNIDKQIPSLVDDLKAALANMNALADDIAEKYGDDSSLIAKVQNITRQLEQVVEKPSDMATSDRLGAFKSNISTIGSWISMFCEQPLELDIIELYGDNGEAPRATANFGESMKHSFDRFVASFTEDYSSMGSVEGENSEALKVWIQSGRDQANILKQLVTSDFTPNSGIGVNIELVTGAIIEATLAGKGPDLALTRPVTDPVNFAMRGALVDLEKFDDYAEVEGYFVENALVPFEYEGGTYALPETMSYQMMFVRSDIMEELGFTDVPDTWDNLLKEYYPIVSRNNMEIGIGNMNAIAAMNASNIFTNLLYQMGGQIYRDSDLNDGVDRLDETALDTPIAYEAFNMSVELYADYLFPQEYDAMSRFRTGEMPILLADYTMYNVFSISIPELDGLWEMYPIPGVAQTDENGEYVLDENGNVVVNNDQAATTTGCVMFKGIGDEARQQNGWEFLKWWVSANTQADFGTRIEAVLGSAGRYATANVAAMEQLPWEEEQLAALQKQMESLVFVEQVPGSYFTSRAINSAFMTSVLNSENPTEQLLYWSDQINMELERKIEEFLE